MLPFIIAGAVGFGIAKLLEKDKTGKFADGGIIDNLDDFDPLTTTTINGNADFRNSQIRDLGNLQTIGGTADFSHSQVENLGNLQTIEGDAYFQHSQVENLGNLQTIGGRAYFGDSQITDLGNLQTIGGYADFGYSKITDLGNLQTIGGTADFSYSQITDLGNLQTIGRSAYFEESKVENLGNLQTIGRGADFGYRKDLQAEWEKRQNKEYAGGGETTGKYVKAYYNESISNDDNGYQVNLMFYNGKYDDDYFDEEFITTNSPEEAEELADKINEEGYERFMPRGFFLRRGKTFAVGGQINSNFAKKKWNSYIKDSKIDALSSVGYSKKVARDLSSEAWESLEKNVQNAFKNYLISEEVEYMKSMMESLYVYGGIERGSYGYDQYLSKYENILGKKMFDKVYEEELERLQEYEVENNTYTDSEGLTYSSLKKKYASGGSINAEDEYKLERIKVNRSRNSKTKLAIKVRARGGYTLGDFFPLLEIYYDFVAYKKVGELELQQIVGKQKYVQNEFKFRTEKDRDYWYNILSYEQEKYFTIKNKKKYVKFVLNNYGNYSDEAEDKELKTLSEKLDYFDDDLLYDLRDNITREDFIDDLDLDVEDKYAGGGSVAGINLENYSDYDEFYDVVFEYIKKEEDLTEEETKDICIVNESIIEAEFDRGSSPRFTADVILGYLTNENYASGGVLKRRRRANAQYGKSDRSVDKTRVAKPVGYRFTDALATKLRKDKYAVPTEKQVGKYNGNGIYKENRRNQSDRNRIEKL